jgi:hypothetical protein
MLTTTLRQLVDSPKRMWIVITITLLFSLVVSWPLVDKYKAAVEHKNDLSQSLSETREMAARLSQFEKTVSNQLNLVSVLDEEAMTPEKVQLFRSRVVHMVRKSGCKMRRIQLTEPNLREWVENDNALFGRGVPDAEATSFHLRTWKFTVTVTGPMSSVSRLLEDLSEEERLMNASRFSLERAEGDGKGAVLEVELDFFELVKLAPDETA